MEVKAKVCNLEQCDEEAVVLFFSEDNCRVEDMYKGLDALFNNALSAMINNKDFKAEKDEIKVIYNTRKSKIKYLILTGMGKKEKQTYFSFENNVANAIRKARELKVKSVALSSIKLAQEKIEDTGKILTFASYLALYKNVSFKSKEKEKEVSTIERVSLIVTKENEKIVSGAVSYATIVSQGVSMTRDIVNIPANIAHTDYMVEYAQKIAKEYGLKCTVFEHKQLEKMGMNCILAVGKGSYHKPKLVVLEYNGSKRDEKPIALVGKGVVFDTGGYSVKTSIFGTNYMLNMKDDKAGAVITLHALAIAAKLKLSVNLLGIFPLVENMISGESYRVDDIYKAYNGLMVEVRNTDAEGRLILADALAYACEKKPKVIVDLATLTGAALIAIGNFAVPIMGNNKELIERIKRASEKSLERVWEFPLWEEYGEALKSDIADIKNVTDATDAGSIIGGIFLKNFVKDNIPWCHIDIAIPTFSTQEKGVNSKGATGFGVRLITELLRGYSVEK